jgi:phosphoribosylformimino-5-aminoimidazole carboxamide ribotide isomerase
MRFRPCIDLHGGKVKQIVGSTLSDTPGQTPTTNFEADKPASYYAELYRADSLRGGHVIMLGPNNEAAALEALASFPGGLQVGGGITAGNAAKYLDSGASHVIVTSYIFSDGRLREERLAEMVRCVGASRLVVDLSCKRVDGTFYVTTDRWQKLSRLTVGEETLNTLAQSCAEFLVHAVDVEGKQGGIDEELAGLLGRYSPVPVTYAGGARSIDDLETIRIAGEGRVDATIGSALDIFGGPLPYRDVVEWHRRQDNPIRDT